MIDKTEIKNTTGLVWFGNDLRIHDNDVLSLAVKNHTKVIGVYIIDPFLFEENKFGFKKMDVFRAQFLLESLHNLKHHHFHHVHNYRKGNNRHHQHQKITSTLFLPGTYKRERYFRF